MGNIVLRTKGNVRHFLKARTNHGVCPENVNKSQQRSPIFFSQRLIVRVFYWCLCSSNILVRLSYHLVELPLISCKKYVRCAFQNVNGEVTRTALMVNRFSFWHLIDI